MIICKHYFFMLLLNKKKDKDLHLCSQVPPPISLIGQLSMVHPNHFYTTTPTPVPTLLSFRSLDCGKIQRVEWSYSEAQRRQVFRTTEMPQCRVRTRLQLMCCTLTLELGVLILEQQKVREWESERVEVCWSRGVTEQEWSLRSREQSAEFSLSGFGWT